MTKQNKKRQSKVLLLIDYNNTNESDRFNTLLILKEKLKTIATSIIGEANAISPYDLFEKVFQRHPEEIDIYRRKFWFDVLKTIMKKLRSDEEVFFIIKSNKIFILDSEKELEDFQHKIDNVIMSQVLLKRKAQRWVSEKKSRKLKREVVIQ